MSLHLFEAVGVELEYMIVSKGTLDVAPIADQLMIAAVGTPEGEIERDHGISWSNELVNHVVEFKTTAPVDSSPASLHRTGHAFAKSVSEANRLLAPLNAQLLGTGMHPWMNPAKETRLWAHEYHEVYANFDRLFDCKRHGWANLQSMHLNLPFTGDEEFGRLHAAVRLVLPILPALCASSPIIEGRASGLIDTRLNVYSTNQSHTPSLTGRVIPEPVFTEHEYRQTIMEPIARDVRRLDSSGIMQPQWMNSRGAIARFDRCSIEIRVMDVQEHPLADLAIAAGVVAVLRWLCADGPSDQTRQRALGVEPLRALFDRTVMQGHRARIDDAAYLTTLGVNQPCDAGELWTRLFTAAIPHFPTDPAFATLRSLLRRGCLSSVMLDRLGSPAKDASIPRERLTDLVGTLAKQLADPALGPLDLRA